jgi:virginiamycin A acetyltransferase
LFNLIKFVREITGRAERKKIVIPYGRHSYGPQPQIIGISPFVTRKVVGSRVGNFCSLSPGLKFVFLGKHDYRCVSTYPFYDFYKEWGIETRAYHGGEIDLSVIAPNPIVVENDVWIASNVIVKEGVTIGSGAVVAMESVVTKDVPAYALVGGNPARVIKYRFSEDQIRELLKICWWDWDNRDIVKVAPLLLTEDIDGFIKKAKGMAKR